MKKLKNILFSVFIVFCMTVNPAWAQNNASLVLSQLLGQIKSYEADFEQSTYDNQNRLIQKSQGKLYLMRPGKFRFDTQKPSQQILLINGNTLWVYDVDLAQVSRQSLTKQYEVNPAALLSGSFETIERNFSVTVTSGSHGQTFILTPFNKEASFSRIRLQFQGNQLVAMLVDNNLEQHTRFLFTSIRLNHSLKKNLFIFKAPKGVDVISS